MKTAELIDQIEENHASYNKQYKKDLKALKAIVIEEQLSDKPKEMETGWYNWNHCEGIVFYKKRTYCTTYPSFEGYEPKGNNSPTWALEKLGEPATDNEILRAFKGQATTLGFKDGMSNIKPVGMGGGSNGLMWNKLRIISNRADYFTFGDGGGMTLFCNDKWAEIIENKLELNGKEVVIQNGMISIGCVKNIDLDEWETFIEVLEKTGCDLSHGDIGHIKFSNLKKLTE